MFKLCILLMFIYFYTQGIDVILCILSFRFVIKNVLLLCFLLLTEML